MFIPENIKQQFKDAPQQTKDTSAPKINIVARIKTMPKTIKQISECLSCWDSVAPGTYICAGCTINGQEKYSKAST